MSEFSSQIFLGSLSFLGLSFPDFGGSEFSIFLSFLDTANLRPNVVLFLECFVFKTTTFDLHNFLLFTS